MFTLSLICFVAVQAQSVRQVDLLSDISKKVVIIEDAQDVRVMMDSLLSIKGFTVHQARNAREGLDQIRAILPDAAIIDIQLPDMSGLELARRIRMEPGIQKIKLIALSGMVLDSNRQDAINAGFNSVLPKPCDFGELEDLLG